MKGPNMNIKLVTILVTLGLFHGSQARTYGPPKPSGVLRPGSCPLGVTLGGLQRSCIRDHNCPMGQKCCDVTFGGRKVCVDPEIDPLMVLPGSGERPDSLPVDIRLPFDQDLPHDPILLPNPVDPVKPGYLKDPLQPTLKCPVIFPRGETYCSGTPCIDDRDCSRKYEMCCTNKCNKRTCIPVSPVSLPVGPNPVYAASCPAPSVVRSLSGPRPYPCADDSECSRRELCCFDGRRGVCIRNSDLQSVDPVIDPVGPFPPVDGPFPPVGGPFPPVGKPKPDYSVSKPIGPIPVKKPGYSGDKVVNPITDPVGPFPPVDGPFPPIGGPFPPINKPNLDYSGNKPIGPIPVKKPGYSGDKVVNPITDPVGPFPPVDGPFPPIGGPFPPVNKPKLDYSGNKPIDPIGGPVIDPRLGAIPRRGRDPRCPAPISGSAAICEGNCRDNNDCQPNRICCFNGCASRCVLNTDTFNPIGEIPFIPPQSRLVPRSGKCPVDVLVPSSVCRVRCQYDNDCTSDEKCCYERRCGNSVCRRASFALDPIDTITNPIIGDSLPIDKPISKPDYSGSKPIDRINPFNGRGDVLPARLRPDFPLNPIGDPLPRPLRPRPSRLDPLRHSDSSRKPGDCPRPGPLMADCPSECRYDGDCPGVKKCCIGGCGKECVAPDNKRSYGP